MYYLTNLLFFHIPLTYYYINLWSSTISCLSSVDIHILHIHTYIYSVYLFSGIFQSSPIFHASFVTVFELFYGEGLQTFVILIAILLPVKSPVASAVLWSALSEVVLSASVANCLAWWGSFWLYLLFRLFLYFSTYLNVFGHILSKRQKP